MPLATFLGFLLMATSVMTSRMTNRAIATIAARTAPFKASWAKVKPVRKSLMATTVPKGPFPRADSAGIAFRTVAMASAAIERIPRIRPSGKARHFFFFGSDMVILL